MARVLLASTVPVTLDLFMRGQLAWLRNLGHAVDVVSSPGEELERVADREGVQAHAIAMEREVSPLADFRALIEWVKLLRSIRPDVSVVSTPKAGLLGGLAACFTRVPRRVYLLRGARFEGESGVKGAVLRFTERIACRCAHTVIAVSPSLADLAVNSGITGGKRPVVVGSGSSNGVDLERFSPPSAEQRAAARLTWGLDPGQVAIVFVGRLHRDKGLTVLSEALKVLGAEVDRGIVLLLAGGSEGADLSRLAESGIPIRPLGPVNDIPSLLHACDIHVLPTQREGFPNVVLEAAASGLPTVTTDATGAIDSVVDGETGIIVGKNNGTQLGLALAHLARDAQLRDEMGARARLRAEDQFEPRTIWEGMAKAYLGVDAVGGLN